MSSAGGDHGKTACLLGLFVGTHRVRHCPHAISLTDCLGHSNLEPMLRTLIQLYGEFDWSTRPRLDTSTVIGCRGKVVNSGRTARYFARLTTPGATRNGRCALVVRFGSFGLGEIIVESLSRVHHGAYASVLSSVSVVVHEIFGSQRMRRTGETHVGGNERRQGAT